MNLEAMKAINNFKLNNSFESISSTIAKQNKILVKDLIPKSPLQDAFKQMLLPSKILSNNLSKQLRIINHQAASPFRELTKTLNATNEIMFGNDPFGLKEAAKKNKTLHNNLILDMQQSYKQFTQMSRILSPALSATIREMSQSMNNLNPIISSMRTIVKSNEFQSSLQKALNDQTFKSIFKFQDYAESIKWNNEELLKLLKEDCKEQSKVSSDSKVLSFNNTFQFLIFLVISLSSGLDISNLADPKKRFIVLGQITHFLLQANEREYNSIKVIKYSCLAKRGCVVRSGPGYKYKKIIALQKGFVFREIHKEKEWTKVEYISSEKGFNEGWVKTSLLEEYNKY